MSTSHSHPFIATVQRAARRRKAVAWLGFSALAGVSLLALQDLNIAPARAEDKVLADTKPRTTEQSPAKGEQEGAAAQPASAAVPAVTQPAMQGLGSYLAAREASRTSDTTSAAKFYERSLAANPKDIRLQKEAIKAYMLSGDMKHAVDLAEKIKAAGEKNQLATMILIVDKVQKKDFVGAKALLSSLDALGMLVLTKPFLGAWLETAQSGQVPLIEIDPKLQRSGFFDSFMYYQKALMFEMTAQNDKAKEFFEKATVRPEITPYRIAIAYVDLLQRSGQSVEAIQFFQEWMDANPDNVLTQGVSAKQVVDDLVARKSALVVTNAQDGIAELMLATANILYSQEANVETMLYLRLALSLKPEFGHARLLLANMLEDDGKTAEALTIYQGIRGDMSVERRAGIRSAFTMDGLGQTAEALKVLAQLEKVYPKCSDVAVAQGDILRKQNRFEGAVLAYTRAIEVSGTLEEKHWPLFYVRGISYERSGVWEQAEADFHKAMELSPDQPDVLNYLAYSWLMQGKKLEQARDMLEKAVAARPDDAHIIDSLGWAYFLLKDYQNAVDYLDQAAEMMPGDPTVNEHLGDALWRVGRKSEARYQWERALTFKPEPAVVASLKQKIASGLMDAKAAANTPPKNMDASSVQK